jgi:thioredoxin-related protein
MIFSMSFRPAFVLAFALCFAVIPIPAVCAGLESASTFAQAQARAKKEKRLLFLMFKSIDCKHCQKFSEQVLATETFQTFARDHLSLMIYQVDAYAALPESEQKLALAMEEKYGVEQMPAIVVFSPDGRELLRTQGYRGTPAETIVAQLRAKLPPR